MSRKFLNGSLLLACSGLLAMPMASLGGAIEWEASYDDARKSAKESGELMMVDFYADW